MKSWKIKLVRNVWKKKEKKRKKFPRFTSWCGRTARVGSELEPNQHQCSACWSLVQQYSHKQVDEAALRVLPTPRNPANYMLRCNSWLTHTHRRAHAGFWRCVCFLYPARGRGARTHIQQVCSSTELRWKPRGTQQNCGVSGLLLLLLLLLLSPPPLFLLLLLLLPTLNPPMPVDLHNPSSQQDLVPPAPKAGWELFQNKSSVWWG